MTSNNTTEDYDFAYDDILTCEAIANSCSALEDTIYPRYQDSVYADDTTWILTSSFVILTMQSGFGLLEIGVASPGNEVNVMMKNVCDLLCGSMAFYLFGYGIAYGEPSNGFMGLGDFAPTENFEDPVESGVLYSQYLFQLSFAATSTTIVSGGIAMRMKFRVYCIFAFWAVTVYSFVAHWVWGPNGWLGALGVHDFAGGGPVHLLGGFNAFLAIVFVGPRKGRFDGSRPASEFVESSPTGQLFGLLVLWFAWIGFNCGSSFGITQEKWLVATRTGVNTMNASAGGGLAGLVYSQWATKGTYVRPFDIVNGVLGGLVSSSPTCACVQTYEAIIIGAVGSFLACWSNEFLFKGRLKIDDPVGAVGAHASAAIWGVSAVGLFAESRFPGVEVIDGLFKGGGFDQLKFQLLEIVAVMGWSCVTMIPFFYAIGTMWSKDWKDPRTGLIHDFPEGKPHQIDPKIHDCMEDNINVEDVLDKIKQAFYDEIRDDVLRKLRTINEEDETEDPTERGSMTQLCCDDDDEVSDSHQNQNDHSQMIPSNAPLRPTLARRPSAIDAVKALFYSKGTKFLGIPFHRGRNRDQSSNIHHTNTSFSKVPSSKLPPVETLDQEPFTASIMIAKKDAARVVEQDVRNEDEDSSCEIENESTTTSEHIA